MNKKTRNVVYKILESDPYARENDNYLIFMTLNAMGGINKESAIWSVLNEMTFKGISFESITSHRRKWLELNPEIKKQVKATKARKEEEKEYLKAIIQGKHIPRID